jgi:hypothetical protein
MHPYIYDVGDLHSLENGKQLYNIMKKNKNKKQTTPPKKTTPKEQSPPQKKTNVGLFFWVCSPIA